MQMPILELFDLPAVPGRPAPAAGQSSHQILERERGDSAQH